MYIATETRALEKSIEEVKPADNGDQKHGVRSELAFLRQAMVQLIWLGWKNFMTSNYWFNVDPPPNYQYIYTNPLHQVILDCLSNVLLLLVFHNFRVEGFKSKGISCCSKSFKNDLHNTSNASIVSLKLIRLILSELPGRGMLEMNRVHSNKSIVKQTLKDYTNFPEKKILPWQRKLQKWHLRPVFSSVLILCIPDGGDQCQHVVNDKTEKVSFRSSDWLTFPTGYPLKLINPYIHVSWNITISLTECHLHPKGL